MLLVGSTAAACAAGEAPVELVLGYVGATLLLLPATPLDLAFGALLGLGRGLVWAQLAATLAAIVAFAVARFVLRERVHGLVRRDVRLRRRLRRIERAIEQRGWRTVLVARALPGLPFGLLSWVLGASRVRASTHALATLVATLPKTAVHVALGAGAGRWIEEGGLEGRGPALLALLAALALLAGASRLRVRRITSRSA